jgi:hypothetical protein
MSSTREEDYCFVIIDEASGRPVGLDVHEYDAGAKSHLQGIWQRLYLGLQGHHKLCGRPAPAWAAWRPWDWCEEKKPGYEGRIKYVAWTGDIPVGFLNVWADYPSAHQPGKSVLYLEHVASAPGNQTTELWNRRFKAVGAALFAYTLLTSRQRGFDGRVGLHVADADASSFYRHIHAKCGSALFFPERTGVEGPTPRRALDAPKTYLETTEAGATRWLEEYRRE